MKHTRGRLVGNIVASVGGWPGSASGVWNRNDALNSVRGNAWPVYSTIPGAPTITGVSRVAGSSTAIDITFTAPASNGGQVITSYTALSTPGNVNGTIGQAGSGTVRVTGLTQGTSYTFVVYATNVVGNSPNSAASAAIIPATVPGAPTIGTPTRVAGSGTQIDVPFSAPASDGGLAITSYTAVSTPGSITGTLSQADSGTIRVAGLTQGTSYTFTVYATNAVGNGTSSAASAGIVAATVPGAPTIGTATATSGSTATVAYTAPASDGGLAITSYTAVSTPGSITGTLSQAGSGTIYGPWGRPDMAYFRMIANVIAGAEFKFFGDGSIERDFTFISDAVRSVINLTLELEGRKPGFSDVVNLGGGRPLSMNYLMEVVGSLTGKKVSFERFETNLNDARKTMSDASYIQNLIGSKPSTKLEDGISTTIEWASRNEISANLDKWVKSVK